MSKKLREYAELLQGETGLIKHRSGFSSRVKIIDTDTAYGHITCHIVPIDGDGEGIVRLSSMELDNAELLPRYEDFVSDGYGGAVRRME
jgi:hypothetical protein